jgi:hypothetical protein
VVYALVSGAAHGTATVAPDGRYVYAPAKDYAGKDVFTFAVSDGQGGRDVYNVNIDVSPVNDAPVVATPLLDRSFTVNGGALNIEVPPGTFTDVDSAALTFSAALSTGQPLPSWLSFSPLTGRFSGVPGPANAGALDIRVTASDGSLSTFSRFNLNVQLDLGPPAITFSDNLPGVARLGTSQVAYTLTFSKPVTGLDAGDFTVTNGVLTSLTGSGATWAVNVVPAAGVASGNIALTLKAGAVQDATGQTNVAATDARQAIDTVAPLARVFSPADGATKVAPGSNLYITFNEAIQRGSGGTIVIKTAAGKVLETFSAGSPGLKISGDTLELDPLRPLDIYSKVLVEFSPGVVTDLAGNAFVPAKPYEFNTATVDGLYHFFLVAFGAAPGTTYMGQLAEAWNYGLSLPQIVDIFTTKSQFQVVYPLDLSTMCCQELNHRLCTAFSAFPIDNLRGELVEVCLVDQDGAMQGGEPNLASVNPTVKGAYRHTL